MGKVLGDIYKYERNEKPSDRPSDSEIKKEMGNMIISTIRWCDDLGYDHEDCINIVLDAQKISRRSVAINLMLITPIWRRKTHRILLQR